MKSPLVNIFENRPLLVFALIFLGYGLFIWLGLNFYLKAIAANQLKAFVQRNVQNLNDNEQVDLFENLKKDFSLYVFGSEGEVVFRHRPFSAPFDTANVDFLKDFFIPRNLPLVTGESWRLASKPLSQNGKQIAIITVGEKINQDASENETDLKLYQALESLSRNLTFSQGQISLPKSYNYYLSDSFLLVDQFGKILAQKGTLPYRVNLLGLKDYLKSQTKTINADNGHYLISSQPTKNGLVIAAQRQPSPQLRLERTLKIAIIAALIFTAISAIVFFQSFVPTKESSFRKLSFNPKTGELALNKKKLVIPLDTNQYYLVQSLLKNPQKWHELDEITDRLFGQDSNPAKFKRPIYDATRLINQKSQEAFNLDLIESSRQGYRLSQKLKVDSQ